MRDNSYNELDEEDANFINKLKRGSYKHKGKVPFICFNCGKVGHFVAKCPYKNKNKEEDSSLKGYMKSKTENKRKFLKENLYSNEDNNSSDESDSETYKILFMDLETQKNVLENGNTDSTVEDNPEVDAEVDLEA
jgi:hypothetical protein